MRVWPYQMLDVLPTKQLVAQWRECLAISGMIASGDMAKMDGINHATINRIKNYPLEHFAAYCDLVREEFLNRNFTIGTNTIEKLNNNFDYSNLNYRLERINRNKIVYCKVDGNFLWENFHNERYIKQCLYSFQEKYDCDMITKDEWFLMERKFNKIL